MGSGRGESGRVQEWADQSLASQGMRGGEQGVGGVERVVRRREAGEERAGSGRGVMREVSREWGGEWARRERTSSGVGRPEPGKPGNERRRAGVGGVERVVRRREAGVMRAVSERGARTGSGWERTEWDCETARATKAPVPVRLIVREGARGRGREASAPLRYHGTIGEGVQPRALQTLRSRHIEDV